MRAYRIAYDGRQFYGFQRQPNLPTIEGALLEALAALGVADSLEEPPKGYAAAGRTDAGVSAIAQTIAFEAPEWLSPRAFNSRLPSSIRAWASTDVPAEFHATHDAIRREYTYWLYAPEQGSAPSEGWMTSSSQSASVPSEIDSENSPIDGRSTIDEDRARAALDRLCGAHDFHNLTPDEDGTRRGLSGRLERDGGFLRLEVAADGFARQLVRRLVTVIRSVGTGAMPLSRIDRLLDPEPISGPEGVPPAPPEPLCLSNVAYGMAEFEPDPVAVASTVSVFGDRAADRLAGGRLADSIAGAVEESLDRRDSIGE